MSSFYCSSLLPIPPFLSINSSVKNGLLRHRGTDRAKGGTDLQFSSWRRGEEGGKTNMESPGPTALRIQCRFPGWGGAPHKNGSLGEMGVSTSGSIHEWTPPLYCRVHFGSNELSRGEKRGCQAKMTSPWGEDNSELGLIGRVHFRIEGERLSLQEQYEQREV